MTRTPLPRPRAAVAAALALLAVPLAAGAQAPADGEQYRMPPAPIAQILDAAPTPTASVSRDGRTMALLGRENLPPIAELAAPDLKLAGFRINPVNNGPANSRVSWLNAITFQDVQSGASRPVQLPAGTRFTFPSWSPDGRRMAFVAGAPNGLELWVADAQTGQARRVTGPVLNAAFGMPYAWLPDASGFLLRTVPAGRGPAPAAPAVPGGPLVQENAGRAAPVRTFQDLLTSPHDEALFEHYFTVQLARVGVDGGTPTPVGRPGLFYGSSVSPDGRYILATRAKRPFSYLVTAQRFPAEIAVLDWQGNVVRPVADLPLADNLPPAFDAVATGPRAVQWRADVPSTLVWVEAQDGGDPRRQAPVRDRVFMLDAPFTGPPVTLVDLDARYGGIAWGRADYAIATSRVWQTRTEKTYALNPSQPGTARLVRERNYQDRYNDPGDPVFTTDARGQNVIHFAPGGREMFVTGDGASQRGQYPWLGRMNVTTGQVTRLWEAKDPHFETLVALLDDAGTRMITRRESRTEPANLFLRTVRGGQPRQLTQFADPAPQLAGVQRQLVTYTRADGVRLSGTLYLPAGYDAARDGTLPLLMWAYPTEFTDAAVAGQVVDTGNRFSRPGGSSHLFLLTQGYAILDNPTMPIIGANGAEPNDTYVQQLVASAQAAVDKMVEMGVADRDRIAVGGHSYGAFMTANLLAHSDLFRAGIARSGAYNRTLTPFGFQAEQRTYWEATDTYTEMSPFTYAHRIQEPILLIHGQADDNSGTFPVQSERMYAALKGNGAVVRYVVLPYEAHGYRARESTMHTLWEMTNWMDVHVKNAGPRPPARATAAAGGN